MGHPITGAPDKQGGKPEANCGGGQNAMAHKSLEEAFVDAAREMYDAERQLTRLLPTLGSAATMPELKDVFTSHLSETQGHIQRLDHVFALMRQDSHGKRCEGMAGIINEATALVRVQQQFDAATMDACLIGAAQRVEHYEMSVYGTLVAWAQQLGHMDVAELLKATLVEEIGADEQLTLLAEEEINPEAAEATDLRPSADLGPSSRPRRSKS